MENTLITLAKIHYGLGLIGQDEYIERARVARWLSAELQGGDPRSESQEEEINDNREMYDTESEAVAIKDSSGKSTLTDNEDNHLELLCLNIWVFTKSDPDTYPSVPHGHYRNKNNAWPKLNPYTGRVFSSKHHEDRAKRLSKKDLKLMWSNEKFKSFCREVIIWHLEQFPHYRFRVQHPLRFPRY